MLLNPAQMEPWLAAMGLTDRLLESLYASCGPDEFNERCAYWRLEIANHQYIAIEKADGIGSVYVPNTPLFTVYQISFRYAMRLYSFHRTQITYWSEGGKGGILAEYQCHTN